MLPEILISTLLLSGIFGFPAAPADQLNVKTPRSEYFILQPALKAQPQFVQSYSIQPKPDSKDQYVLLYPNQFYHLRDDENWVTIVQNWWESQQQGGGGGGGGDSIVPAAASPAPASPEAAASPDPAAQPPPAMRFFLKNEDSGKEEKKYYYLVPAASPAQFYRQVNPFQIIPSVRPVLAAPASPLEPKFVLQPLSLRGDFKSEAEQQQQPQQPQQQQPQQPQQQQQPQFFLQPQTQPQIQPQMQSAQQQFFAQQEQRKDEIFPQMNAAAAAFMSGAPMGISPMNAVPMALDASQMNTAPKSDFFVSPVSIRTGENEQNSELVQQAMQRLAPANGNIGLSLRSGGSADGLESVLLPESLPLNSASLPLNAQQLQLESAQQPQRLLNQNADDNKEQQPESPNSLVLNNLLPQAKSNAEARNEQNLQSQNANSWQELRNEQNNNEGERNEANRSEANRNEEKRKDENQNEQNRKDENRNEPNRVKEVQKPSDEQNKREEKRKDDSSIAQAKPNGLSLAGEGGVASSSPSATALVGKNGLALASPSATAVAGDFGSLAGGGLLSSRE